MKFDILGKRKSAFPLDNGVEMTGTTIYGTYVAPQVEGLCTDKFFIKTSVEDFNNIIVNSTVELFFNRRGKVEFIIPENEK